MPERFWNMQLQAEVRRELVLVGGGHSHALVLRSLAMKPIEGLRITLVSPASHTPYSGMLPGLVAGHYRFEESHIDLARLCHWAGVRFICAEVTGLDPVTRCLALAGRPELEYDLLSIDIGSRPELDSVPGARAHAIPVKPVAGFWQRWRELQARVSAREVEGDHRVAVVGGGAGSVELAMAMAASATGASMKIDLWCGGSQILQNYNPRARSAVMNALERQGVEVHLDSRVERVEGDVLQFASGAHAIYDDLFWCTGASAAQWIADTGLETDEAGFLLIGDTLQSVDDERVFGSGDIATQRNHPRPKAGVYAVRQGPILAHNLRACLLEQPLKVHRPQQRFLSLISLGERRATADRGPFAATGFWVWRWKDRIDRKFMARFEDLPQPMPSSGTERLPELQGLPRQHCGGCGAKVGGDALAEVLRSLAQDFPDHCSAEGDDCAPLPDSDGLVLQSIDTLREMVADPWLMGRIAAVHALSDVYACGGRPISAMATICLPFSGSDVQRRELRQLLAGALFEFSAADCRLSGGHSMQGMELSVGFAVNGVVVPTAALPLAKRGLKAGDQLVLTKALGTGCLFAAHMSCRADGRDIELATRSMLHSNASAGELAVAATASSATDITGFGLLGHLLEMLGRGQTAVLFPDEFPVLPGAYEALQAGCLSTMHESNLRSFHYALGDVSVVSSHQQIVFDPQTSGGLLIGVAAGSAAALVDKLREGGYESAAVIGEVRETLSAEEPSVLLEPRLRH